MYIYIYVCVYIYIYTYIYMYVYIHTYKVAQRCKLRGKAPPKYLRAFLVYTYVRTNAYRFINQ